MLTLKLIGAALFIVTGGAVFSDRFKRFRLLAGIASIVAIAGAYFLITDIVDDLVQQGMAGRSASATPVETTTVPRPVMAEPAQSETKPESIEELCSESQSEWQRTEAAISAGALRGFLNTVPVNCLSLRSEIAAKLETIEIEEEARAEERAYSSAIVARSRDSYSAFINEHPQSSHIEEIRNRLSSCRQTLAPTGRYNDKEIFSRGEVFDSRCVNISDCDSYEAASLRAVGRCRNNLQALCSQIGGALYNINDLGVRGLGVNADCSAQCRIPESAYQEICD